MTIEDFSKELNKIDIPSAYGVFQEEQTLPFILYDTEDTQSFHADNTTYASFENIRLELYTQFRDDDAEKKIEDLLNYNELAYEKETEYNSEQKNRKTTFYFSLL